LAKHSCGGDLACRVRNDNVNFQPDQLGRKIGAALGFASCRPKFNQNIFPLM